MYIFLALKLQFNFADIVQISGKTRLSVNPAQNLNAEKFLKVPGKCYTDCCGYSKIEIVRKCSEFENLEPCRVAYGMGNGVLAFRHSAERSRDCTEFLKEKLISSRRQPVQSHKDRIRACYAADSCLSSNADVFLHICREFAEEEHVLSSRGYQDFTGGKRRERVMEAILDFSSLNQTRNFIRSFKEFDGMSTYQVIGNAVRKSMENLNKQQLPLSEIYVLASLSCSAASMSAIPFQLDLQPITSRFRARVIDLAKKSREELMVSDGSSYNLIAVTYSNGPNIGLDLLLESAQLHNITVKILGWGEKNPSPAQKLKACLEFLQTLEPRVVVIFLDAFDAFFVRDANVILERFFFTKSYMVFGGENACYPLMYPYFNFGLDLCQDESYFPKIPKNKIRYINTGQWIGYATVALEVLADYMKLVGEDHAEIFPGTDQFALELMRINGAWNITLDYDARIFMVGMSYSDQEVAHMNTTVMHFNGDKPRAHRWAKRHLEQNCYHSEQEISNFPLNSVEIYGSCNALK